MIVLRKSYLFVVDLFGRVMKRDLLRSSSISPLSYTASIAAVKLSFLTSFMTVSIF